jgi:hypothetical protein
MRKFPKLSQKERKKLAAGESSASPAKAVESPKPAAWSGWGTPKASAAAVAAVDEGGAAVPSLVDIMQVEARSRCSGEDAVR